MLLSKDNYGIYIEGSQMYILVINGGPFIYFPRLPGGGDTISGEICLK
jgi:hypothetical protein